ncbi:MAG TPA: phage/plasmid primase, P4 family [Candidatus Paceibacterota bacterium]|nr:phage/plasmid primase, P4 family [Verrucomicrobiota bacterium]HSA12368.1 phage/plasmid primase, P4 family [Candidatus Paceibacterota bacterium]
MTTSVETTTTTVADHDVRANGSDPQVAGFKAWAEGNGVVVPVALPGMPDAWFDERFPGLREQYGPAVLLGFPPKQKDDEETMPLVKDLCEDFLAATLGELGTPMAPTVFMAVENRFYTYDPNAGIFAEVREPKLIARLSQELLMCANDCSEQCDTTNLKFRFRDTADLRGVVNRARGLLEVGNDYFETSLQEYIACHNGMLRLADREVLPFNASYRRRNKLTVDYVKGASCPMFLDLLMRPALSPEELDLLQRWCGLALIGVNLAQRMMVLTGTAGGGKGTFIRVLRGIIGADNLATLRPMLLGERFEVGRFLGKSLLYGADVPENFLSCKGASSLKSLIGGDPMTLEFKGSNERPEIVCRFNAIVTCNSRLTVHLEGDAEAWRRRLAIVEYKNPKPQKVITDLSEQILTKEAPGVLNWMLEGLEKLRADGWNLQLSDGQQRIVDDLLLESEGDVVFARECLHREEGASLTVAKCYEGYVAFCNERGWVTMPRKRFSNVIGDTVTRQFGLTLRHDLSDDNGKNQRGWRGLICMGTGPDKTEVYV